MDKYVNYKDSSYSWIGEIPTDWEIVPAKSVFSENRVKNIDGNVTNALQFKFGKIISKKNFDAEKDDYVAGTITTYTIVEPDTIIINGLNLNYDLKSLRVGIVKEKGVITSAYLAIIPNKLLINPNFANYLLKGYETRMAFHNMGSGVRLTLGFKEFKNQPIVLPDINTQHAIIEYLDKQTNQIESIIAEAKASIEEYKQLKASVIYEAVTKGLDTNVEMKDSRVPWIGLVPSNWDTCSIKHLTSKIGSGKTPSGGAEVYTDQGIIFLRSQNVYNEGLRLEDVSHIPEEIDSDMANTRVRYRDVLLNITGGSIGRCCIYNLIDMPANVNQHVCIIRTDSNRLLPEFLRYFWNSSAGPMVVAQYQTGGNRPGLNFEQIGSTKIPYCNISTQQQIVDYLDSKCSSIDSLISEKEALISDLEAYKKSLIYEVVTGKRKVV